METGGAFQFVLLALGVLAVSFALLRSRRRRSMPERPPGTFDDPALDPPRRDLERLLADIQELSRDHIARLDTKIRLLDQLVQEADRKQRELSALLSRAGAAPPAGATPARPANPLHEQVYALQDQGRELLDICQATGLEKGEVELILGLRKMDPPSPSP